MKTLKDLREMIISNEGNIKIGGINFSHKEGEDVDIKLNDNLIMWFKKNESDEALLSEVEYSTDSDIEEGKRALREERERVTATEAVEKLEQSQLAEVTKQLAEVSLALGKVEAYEKMLIGRTVTLGQ